VDTNHRQRELPSGHSELKHSTMNVQGTVSMFLLFFSRGIVHKNVVETNHYADNL
jgi:hypothetical protein